MKRQPDIAKKLFICHYLWQVRFPEEGPHMMDFSRMGEGGCLHMMTCTDEELRDFLQGPDGKDAALHALGCSLCGVRVSKVLHAALPANVPAAAAALFAPPQQAQNPMMDDFVSRHICCH